MRKLGHKRYGVVYYLAPFGAGWQVILTVTYH